MRQCHREQQCLGSKQVGMQSVGSSEEKRVEKAC